LQTENSEKKAERKPGTADSYIIIIVAECQTAVSGREFTEIQVAKSGKIKAKI
jgi:hypothetical protein